MITYVNKKCIIMFATCHFLKVTRVSFVVEGIFYDRMKFIYHGKMNFYWLCEYEIRMAEISISFFLINMHKDRKDKLGTKTYVWILNLTLVSIDVIIVLDTSVVIE